MRTHMNAALSASRALRRRRLAVQFSLLISTLIVLLLLSICVGRYPISLNQIWTILFSHHSSDVPTEVYTVFYQIRLPRIGAAILIGAALAASGSVYQGLFKNPLVSPDVLGASQGAGFGAALGILLGLGYWNVTALSAAGGLLAVLIATQIGKRFRQDPILGLVLAGIMAGSLFSAGISYVKLVADPTDQLPSITYWLMGSLASIRPQELQILFPLVLIGLLPLFLLRHRLNLITLGEEEAKALGLHPARLRAGVIAASTLLTAGSVAFTGMIGWIGLVIPHLVRRWTGPSYSVLLPGSCLAGAAFLLLADNLSRNLTTTEIPLGILTTLVGAPFFLYLLAKGGKN